jgi:hypothetical protein
MTREEALQAFKEVRENLDRLRGCEGHRFGALDIIKSPLASYRCSVCGGMAGFDYILAYRQGFKAAGGDPKLICEGIE